MTKEGVHENGQNQRKSDKMTVHLKKILSMVSNVMSVAYVISSYNTQSHTDGSI